MSKRAPLPGNNATPKKDILSRFSDDMTSTPLGGYGFSPSPTMTSGSGSSTSSVGSYLKYELFENIRVANAALRSSSRNISGALGSISKHPEVIQAILDIKNRDSEQINDPVKNKVLASIICYKKDDFAGSFKEIEIKPLESIFVNPEQPGEYKKEVREFILEYEKKAVAAAANLRITQIDNELLSYDEKGFSQKYLDELNTQLNIEKAGMFLRNKDAKYDEEMKQFLRDQKVEFSEESDSAALRKKISSCMEQLKKFPKDAEYQFYKKRFKVLEKEKRQCEELQKEDVLDQAVTIQRGHSEDYLHYIMQQDGFMDYLKSQIPNGANRIYLLVFSTRDSCDRCSDKMQELALTIGNALNPENSPEIDCKILFFANQRMRDREGSGYIKEYLDQLSDDNLSDSEAKVVNIPPRLEDFCTVVSPGVAFDGNSTPLLQSASSFVKSSSPDRPIFTSRNLRDAQKVDPIRMPPPFPEDSIKMPPLPPEATIKVLTAGFSSASRLSDFPNFQRPSNKGNNK